MSRDFNTIEVVIEDSEVRDLVNSVLSENKRRIINAVTGNEARLKFSNERVDFVILDIDIKGIDGINFIESIRRKEDSKNIKDRVPVLIISNFSDRFNEAYVEQDNVQFLQKPFTAVEFKKKMLTFTKHSDIINENTKSIKEGECLITEGAQSSEMFWILNGKFRITKENQDGKNIIIGEANAGELIGEMSFLDGQTRSATVVALEDSEVLVIPHKRFIDVIEGQPRWFRGLMITLSQRLRNANKIIARKNIVSNQEDSNESSD